MKDEDKTRAHLISELEALRKQVAQLEAREGRPSRSQEAEEAPTVSRRQVNHVIEFLPDATLVIDRNGRVIAWNRAIERMTGVAAAEILGKGDYAYAIPFYGEPRPILIDFALNRQPTPSESYNFLEFRHNTLYAEVFVGNAYGAKGAYLWGTASPLFDGTGTLIGAIECIRDISERKAMEAALRQREQALKEKTHQLEETNIALKVLLKKRLNDQKELRDNVLCNMKEMIGPTLEKLREISSNEIQQTHLDILESHLNEILSPFLKNLATGLAHLTPMEIKIASLVRDGKTSQEIARQLGIARKTVSVHRYNLREKLQLKNEKINLCSYLLSIEED